MEDFSVKLKETNDESTIRLETNQFIIGSGFYKFKSKEEAKLAPLVHMVFEDFSVQSVSLGLNFITIKFRQVEGKDEIEELLAQIENFINSDKEIIKEELKRKYKRVPVTVYAEMTPSPGILKFACNKNLVSKKVEFNYNDNVEESPLAEELFNFSYVKRVSFNKNEILITKGGKVTWDEVMMELREFLRSYLMQKHPVLVEEF